MVEYKSKEELIVQISNTSKLFIEEFYSINEKDKDILIDEVDRTPSQMIAYQLGWMNLLLSWEQQEAEGNSVITPTPEYKWNNLGGLYKNFYAEYEKYTLSELCHMFKNTELQVIDLINNYTDEEFFKQGSRKWASSTPSNWPVWKWIHINTVAPFKTFRAKVRKWKKIQYK